MADRRSISVLVPVLNEVSNVRPTVETLLKALSETADEYEVIVVDDGSTDGTREEAGRLASEYSNVRVLHEDRNRGIGHAYKRGYAEALCKSFVYIPGDNTWPYESCRQLFGQLGRADIVTSYALNPEVRPLGRRILSPLYTTCLNLLFGRNMHYYNGLNIYPVSFLRARTDTASGFGFQAQVLLEALAAGLTYVEIGLMIDERNAGGSKAISSRNVFSVITTVLSLFWKLRLCGHTAKAGNL